MSEAPSSQPSGIVSNTLHTAAIAGLETAVNAALQLDPFTLKQLAELRDHIFLIDCTRPALQLYIIPGDKEVRLCGRFDSDADTTLTGSFEEFAKLATAEDAASALINGDVELHGNSEALIKLQKIISQLDVDWEAPLADLFGDVVGHGIGEGIRQGLKIGIEAAKGLRQQFEGRVDDYLKSSELIVRRPEAETQFNAIDQLVLRAERLAARIQQRQKQIDT